MCLRKYIKYPKITLFILTILIALVVFYEAETYLPLHNFLISLGYLGTLITGFFYSYGYTATTATALLLVLGSEQNIYITALIGGVGALISDLIIFYFIRHSFNDELNRLKEKNIIKNITTKIKNTSSFLYKYFIYFIASLLIASPLPTEIGISLLSNNKNITPKKFIFIAYIMHTIGIFIILLFSSLI